MAVATQQRQVIDLRPEHLTRTILRLSIPSVAESILTTMVYLVDTILIGWLNNPAVLAAVGLSGTLLWTADGLFQAISISASSMVARHWGQRDFERALAVGGQALTVSVLVAGILMAVLIPACGAGDTRTPMIVTLAGTVLFRVPVTYLFAISLNGGLKGIWLATAVDWSMRALIMFFFYIRGRWKTVVV